MAGDLAIEAFRQDMNRLRGNLFQFVEAVGLPEHQQDAFKGVVRSITYASQANIEAALRRSGDS